MSFVGPGRWCCLLVVLVASAVLAPGAGAATLSGTVTDELGGPIAGIEVSAYTSSDSDWQLAGFVETGADGSYLLDGLAEGAYRVLFRDWSQVYAFQFHPGVASIDDAWDVAVTSGGAVVDAALPLGGRITGVISDGAGAPLEFPMVFVYSAGDDPEVLFVGQVDEPTGIYEVGGLPTGDFLMMFSGRRGTTSWTEYWDDELRLPDATPVPVTAGAVTSGIDGQLGPPPGGYPGGLEGIVSALGGSPLAGIEVSVYANVGPGEWTLVSFQSTDADGAFAFLELPADTYTLGFRDWNQVYAYSYWGGVDRLDAAVPIEVDGIVLLTDTTLDVGGRISGRLTDPEGDPLDNAMVFVHTTDDPPQVLFLTNPDPATGDYQLGGLPTGDYLVQFSGWQGLDSYVGYYDGVSSIDLAQPVPVTLGEVTGGIDGELGIPPGGVIAGRITDPYGRAFDFARVRAYRDDGGSWLLAGEAETLYYEPEYELSLPPGTYRLRFQGGSFLQPDLPTSEVFDDVLTLDAGTDVPVVLDQRVEGFDVAVGNLATGSIAGTVTDAGTGTPVSGIEVWVADRRGRVLFDQIATTDATGAYRVDGLWPERYTVELYDPTYTYQTRAVGPVLVGEDPVAGLDGSLDLAPPGTLPGAITGTVRDDGGQPLFGVRVSASSLDGSTFGTALTDSEGRYRVRDLPSDQYEVRFDSRDGFQVSEYFDDVTDPDAATPVPVAMAATTAGIDADLAPAGIVTGSITNRFGTPFQIATAIVYENDGGEWSQVATTSVVSDSEYRIPAVPVGTYRVQLIGGGFGGSSSSEFFDDAPTIELGTDVEVAAGQITAGISGSLGEGPPGAIAGTVTDGAGAALEGILVRIYDEGFELEAEAVTGPDGGYEAADLFRGRYSVEFTDPQGVYPGEAYDNVASLDLATPVLVDDAPVIGIDAALDGAGTGPGGGGIRGVVTDAVTGAGIEGVRVSCVDELFSFPADCSTHTSADGSYELGGFLTTGSYVVRFSAPNGGWVEEWYDDVRPPLQPTPVTVTEGAWTDGIDAELEPAGAISGTVTNDGGGAFSRLTVTAFRFDGSAWQPFDGTTVVYDTHYELGGLPEGSCRLKFLGGSIFNPNTGMVEFYDDVLTVEDGTDVPVVVGQTTAGIDAVLEPRGPGAIAGLVTDAAGVGLAGIEVRVYDDEFVLAETGTTAADGGYLVDDLFSGRYSVEFVDPSGVYPSEAYDNVASIDLATPVLVGQGTTAGIDAVLDGSGSGPGGGGVRGVVTDAVSGAPVEGIRVRCVDEFFGLVDGCATTTGPDGRYRLGGFLPTGSYLIEFSASDGFFADEWYDDVRPPLQPTPVAVLEGSWTDGIDAELEPAGGVSGTVTNQSGDAYSRTTITTFRQEGASWVEYARTDIFYDTQYELRGLPEGIYRVKLRGGSIFNPSFGVEEFFDDAPTIELAADVAVTVGAVTSGISAVLGNLGGLDGGVVNASFDTGLDGWTVDQVSGVSVHHGSPDVGGTALSGSLEVTSDGGVPAAAQVSQCVPVTGGSVVDFGAWSRVSGPAASAATSSVRLEIWDDVDCNGVRLAEGTSPPRTGAHDWSPVVGSAMVQAGAAAARLVLSVDAALAGGLVVNWDEAFIETATDAVFADGFESGSTSSWSGAKR